jgi:hypothetical protein
MTAPKIPQPVSIPTPDWETVREQDDVEMHVVPVDIRGIVPTWSLPAKYGTNRSITVDALSAIPVPLELIPADPRLKRVWISATGTTVVVGTKEQIMKTGVPDGFSFSSTVPMPWEGFKESLYGICTTAGPQTVSLRFEYWAD